MRACEWIENELIRQNLFGSEFTSIQAVLPYRTGSSLYLLGIITSAQLSTFFSLVKKAQDVVLTNICILISI
jgi:hypothetical protein